MGHVFKGAFYATPRTVGGLLTFKDYDDRGSLDVSQEGIRFAGRKVDLSLNKVVGVSLVRHQIPWLAIAVANLGLVALLVIVLSAIASDRSTLFRDIAVVMAVSLVVLLIHSRDKWVKVDYEDELNTRRSACFADGSMRGWRGPFGGTKDLYRAIQDQGLLGEVPETD